MTRSGVVAEMSESDSRESFGVRVGAESESIFRAGRREDSFFSQTMSSTPASPIESDVPAGFYSDSKLYFDPSGKCMLLLADSEQCSRAIKSKTGNKSRHLKDEHGLVKYRPGTHFRVAFLYRFGLTFSI